MNLFSGESLSTEPPLSDQLGPIWLPRRTRRARRARSGLSTRRLTPPMSAAAIQGDIPTQAGIPCVRNWIPACAGMTRDRICFARASSLDSRLRLRGGRTLRGDDGMRSCRRDEQPAPRMSQKFPEKTGGGFGRSTFSVQLSIFNARSCVQPDSKRCSAIFSTAPFTTAASTLS